MRHLANKFVEMLSHRHKELSLRALCRNFCPKELVVVAWQQAHGRMVCWGREKQPMGRQK